jgi:hypothetical protein
MARKKPGNPADIVTATLGPVPTGTATAEAPDVASRGRRTNGSHKPRGRKPTETEVDVIAVKTETPAPHRSGRPLTSLRRTTRMLVSYPEG